MVHSLNQYFVNINTGVPYPYYNQKSYADDNGNANDLDQYTEPAGSDYAQIFHELIEIEYPRRSQEPTSGVLCHYMTMIEKDFLKNGKVDNNRFLEFELYLKKYFTTKYWSFDIEGSDVYQKNLVMMQRKLAKVAVDLHKRIKPSGYQSIRACTYGD
jgi:hypothetical protein